MMPLMPSFKLQMPRAVSGDNFRRRPFTVQSVQRRSERGVKCGPFEIRQETDARSALFKLKL